MPAGPYRAAAAAGATWLQYRNKTASDALRREQATALQALCAEHGVPLIVNDDPALAKAVGAAGAPGRHRRDIPSARALLGAEAIIGASCYDQLANAEKAVAGAATWPSARSSRPRPRSPAAARIPACCGKAPHWACRVAIGGLTPDNVGPIIDAPIWSPWSAACSPPKTRSRPSAPTSPSSRNAQESPMNHDQSHALFSRAQQLLPGGVNRRYARSNRSVANRSSSSAPTEPTCTTSTATATSTTSVPGAR